MIKRILILDKDHPYIIYKLRKEGFICDENYSDSIEKIIKIISLYDGIILRSRLKLNKNLLKEAKKLRFIARIGSGVENIDKDYAYKNKITLISTPEGNRDSVAEHAIAMLLSIMNHLFISNQEIRKGKWNRESNRGREIKGKIIGIIGYGNTGKAFAKKLSGFEATILCYDILPKVGDIYAQQVDMKTIFMKSDIISLHVPYTRKTKGMINEHFIKNFSKPFYFINTSRGGCVLTDHLVKALKNGKICGACLDVIEYEKYSFENFFYHRKLPKNFFYLIHSKKVILTPHIAGWTKESKYKMAQIIVKKILSFKEKNSIFRY
ncbi:putative phosphoglycerate dehydrogenase [Blattabacterium sp. (Periplaneta americana) str. BPLAN]|uniref:NAD(P)-dependent oxidoreductase n=1 Tax=Blattabacterium sp. (Periplaneta americana) TaxID=367488 RepID=UPI0001CFAA89|nr:NAD(P)-dependent oxidoreductase [Blattabacterium sp. (Periplaneta americana)]ACX83973.2 putative phosphoglycerate dehydrogenase [Blattabacterium sp. (Periplaneta americana) str. BPLAN]